jgi:very-short-patch-repair endonuclease
MRRRLVAASSRPQGWIASPIPQESDPSSLRAARWPTLTGMDGRFVTSRCAGLGGVARTGELAEQGVSRHALRQAVSAGVLIRLREGLYAHPSIPVNRRAAAAHGGMLTCSSALEAAGLWVMPYAGLHIAVLRRGRVHSHEACQCVVHRVERAVVLGRRSSVARALAAVLRCQGEEAFFVSLESALYQGRLSSTRRGSLMRRIPARSRWLIELARSDAESGLESLFRLRLHRFGVSLRSQVFVPGVGRVDFVIGDRLIIEIDGKANHEGRSERHKDLARDAIAAGLGFETLRFDYAMVMHDWPTVLAVVLAKVQAGAHLA